MDPAVERNLRPEIATTQAAAIWFTIRLAKQIQEDFPEVAQRFLAGETLRSIDSSLDLTKHYSIQNPETTRKALGLALAGCDHHTAGFEGLISDRDLIKTTAHQHRLRAIARMRTQNEGIFGLSAENLQEAGRKGGIISGPKTRDEGLGLFSRSLDQRRRFGKELQARSEGIFGMTSAKKLAACKRGGQAASKLARETGKGIFALSPQELIESGRAIGKAHGRANGKRLVAEGRGAFGMNPQEKKEALLKATLAKGQVPWKDRQVTDNFCLPAELELADQLWRSHEYRKGSRVDLKRIAARLNEIYHDRQDVRNSSSVNSAVRHMHDCKNRDKLNEREIDTTT